MNKDPDIVSEESPLVILGRKSAICMAKNGKNTKHTSHISKILHLLRNGEKCKMHKIYWYERGLQLADISTRNIGENDLNPIMKYFLVRIENWYRTLAQEGCQDTG